MGNALITQRGGGGALKPAFSIGEIWKQSNLDIYYFGNLIPNETYQ